jgi:hypothetical protein
MLRRLWLHLRFWWRGELGPDHPIDAILRSRDGLVRPWPVRILYDTCFILKGFWLREWRWLIPRIIAVVAIIVGAVIAIY